MLDDKIALDTQIDNTVRATDSRLNPVARFEVALATGLGLQKQFPLEGLGQQGGNALGGG